MADISEVTRRDIIDRIWDRSGRLQEDQFLSRLYDLSALPSDDGRFKDAAGDIWQHRVNNLDWNDNWIFYDRRFNLLRGSNEEFLRFLCETVHPIVKPDTAEAEKMVDQYNQYLKKDGWELIVTAEISGRPVFTARDIADDVEIFEEPTGWPKVDRQKDEIRLRVRTAENDEHFQSVGHLCRETLITLAQTIYDRQKHPPQDGVEPSATDAKRMLDAFFAAELPGAGNANARKHAKAAFDLANGLQHDRGATFRDAALCAEATLSVIRIAAVISGRREVGD